MIHTKISKSLGHEKFNEVIREKLMAHLVHCAIHVDVEPPPRNGASKVQSRPPHEFHVFNLVLFSAGISKPGFASRFCSFEKSLGFFVELQATRAFAHTGGGGTINTPE